MFLNDFWLFLSYCYPCSACTIVQAVKLGPVGGTRSLGNEAALTMLRPRRKTSLEEGCQVLPGWDEQDTLLSTPNSAGSGAPGQCRLPGLIGITGLVRTQDSMEGPGLGGQGRSQERGAEAGRRAGRLGRAAREAGVVRPQWSMVLDLVLERLCQFWVWSLRRLTESASSFLN